ncbi:TPA: hypothetical protein DCZ46_03380 [Candidatus Campbellbacteria bacterium]|jgi:ABC-type transport system involved in cytochrome bd biosynthesis fused ATPase/permease subunit|uniref:Uncharacterized protein n=2 Tax=Candidatus Campbelliibacteriota TaxID=1752727 RepID=A0A1F5EMY6_9BACT|nr:MAG: protein of unknown function with transmembrane region [Candidatus Campbellbacteria bacterium GW2011_OD1_34_28]KKP74829.1 MAG: hypothetical protein UR74_C0002G0095 [Candidatus Campbellbacteria bacterium GW2011_GWD2_35_24]KKP75715.1 MAG: hypothetical protein UR75_C0002G0096 [Candidatus Campbellbacteria bacterium GW2011_GWC2_35_28]KKP77037.1 MAG: hypothetical protein UR76_C0002G0238 [Candidatus Campbellbacteria bacterium GW2011_GWC1_35_31]KKP78963.1 MAG: hypothetical protein UR79_C0002G023
MVINILIFSQILFYLSVSFAVIILGVLTIIIFYHLIKVARSLDKISENIEEMSEDLSDNLEYVLKTLATLPILSFFFKKKEESVKNKKKSKK